MKSSHRAAIEAKADEAIIRFDPSLYIKQNTENDIDDLFARAEQAFRLRQYTLSQHQRDVLKHYGRTLVEQAVSKIEELNHDTE